MICGKIKTISGSLVEASGMTGVQMYELVHVSEKCLLGEVIELRGDLASILLYENAPDIGPGESVRSTGEFLSVELAPGLIESVFDGIQRPLERLCELSGDTVHAGIRPAALDREKRRRFSPRVNVGTEVTAGDVLGHVQETPAVLHKIMVPPGISGKVTWIGVGDHTIEEPIAKIMTASDEGEVSVAMLQKWPVRTARPYAKRLPAHEPLITGQRAIDTFFPIAKGGTAATIGAFGSGKTTIQQQLAKWSDADIIIYVNCGERGNETAELLKKLPVLNNPRIGVSLMKRTILIANTSDMPIAARESAVYMGLTIAEYYRDMGYNVMLIADSLTRWAEALRETGELQNDIPCEGGYPAYLSSRLADFYERAGSVVSLGKEEREGSLTVSGTISPAGGDTFEPVSQAVLRMANVCCALSDTKAHHCQFPAIEWNQSYSFYKESDLRGWFSQNAADDWHDCVQIVSDLLSEEAAAAETVKILGANALSAVKILGLETARSVREDYLHQNAFHNRDSHTSLKKQYLMLKLIVTCHKLCKDALDAGISVHRLINLPAREDIRQFKYAPERECAARFESIVSELNTQINASEEGAFNA